jgi:hypothetical protein
MAEFKEYIQANFILLDQKPDLKTTRTTGLGHTGTK